MQTYLGILLQYLLNHLRQALEAFNYGSSTWLQTDSVLGHDQGKHGQGKDLGGVCLGGGHSNFWTGIDVHSAVGVARDRRANGVSDAQAEGATLLTVPQRHQGVSSLTRLRNEEADIVPTRYI